MWAKRPGSLVLVKTSVYYEKEKHKIFPQKFPGSGISKAVISF